MDNQIGTRSLQLKKIKRPINRVVPQSENKPEQVKTSPFSVNKTIAEADDSLNNYLDEPGLPTKEYRKSEFASAKKVNETKFLGELEDDSYDVAYSNSSEWLNTKIFILVACLTLFVGIVAGKFIFEGTKVVRNGLQGVVVNSEVPRGRARCGVAERTQGCVLYVMNPQRQEMRAKDFYDIASQMTGRQRFMIETGNMRYANTRINPGDIVQLNIPPL